MLELFDELLLLPFEQADKLNAANTAALLMAAFFHKLIFFPPKITFVSFHTACGLCRKSW
ncbi:MAG: hypothetical protein PUF89_02940 [Lactobacillus porci]|nr:hypothetical protein [Lactobacillus porci]